MSGPDVSVIVLTYNQEATVARAIDSVLAQEAGPFSFEVLIGEDASTDATREICIDYAKRYPDIVRIMPLSANKGVVRNYFDTLSECRGRYIADCAGDDYWTDVTRLRRQAALLDTEQDVVITHGAWREVDITGTTLRHCRPYGTGGSGKTVEGRELLEPLLAHLRPTCIHLSTAMYRADVARKAISVNRSVVDNPDFQCEDLPLTAALLASGRVAYDPTELLAYTVGESTVSNPENIEKALRFYAATVRCTNSLAHHYGVRSAALEHYFRSRAIYMAKLARHAGSVAAVKCVRDTMASIQRQIPFLARLILIYARSLG